LLQLARIAEKVHEWTDPPGSVAAKPAREAQAFAAGMGKSGSYLR
jgi:hypothetical protein